MHNWQPDPTGSASDPCVLRVHVCLQGEGTSLPLDPRGIRGRELTEGAVQTQNIITQTVFLVSGQVKFALLSLQQVTVDQKSPVGNSTVLQSVLVTFLRKVRVFFGIVMLGGSESSLYL